MQMYSIPKPEIIEAVEALGATVIDVHEDGLAGDGWLSYCYCVRK
jgi:hypothetical protein